MREDGGNGKFVVVLKRMRSVIYGGFIFSDVTASKSPATAIKIFFTPPLRWKSKWSGIYRDGW